MFSVMFQREDLDINYITGGIYIYNKNNRGGMGDTGKRKNNVIITDSYNYDDFISPGGYNGGGGTLLKQFLHTNNILAETTTGFKHITSSMSNTKSLYDEINNLTNPKTVDSIYYVVKGYHTYGAFGKVERDSLLKLHNTNSYYSDGPIIKK